MGIHRDELVRAKIAHEELVANEHHASGTNKALYDLTTVKG